MISAKYAVTYITAAVVVGGAGFAYAQVELDRSPAITTEKDIEATGAMRAKRQYTPPLVITEKETVVVAATPEPAPAPSDSVVIAANDTPAPAAPADTTPAEPMAKADRN